MIKRTYTQLTGGKQNARALCAYNWASIHVGFGYEQDMWRILMQITLFLFKSTQNHAPDSCYRTMLPGISGQVYLNTSLLHIERSIYARGTPIHHDCVPYPDHALNHVSHGNYTYAPPNARYLMGRG